jgi:Fur family peroxide stress response transcriptional regulator
MILVKEIEAMFNATEIKTLRNTKQRQYLLDLLQSTQSHPNAFWLFDRMKPVFPHLSLSTVYRNLGVLEQQGQIQRITCSNDYDRYDANTNMHAHFYCRKCSRVYDIDTDRIEKKVLESVENCAHSLEGCHVTFYGICDKCTEK